MNRLKNAFRFGKNTTKAQQLAGVTASPPESLKNVDLIGPADKISNLRKYRYYIPENESKLEYDYRIRREQVNTWNHEYWTQQNLKFIQSKRSFVENLKTKKLLDKKLNSLTTSNDTSSIQTNDDTDEMKEFYRNFLNDNYYNHYEYNKKWFWLNLGLLWPAARVFMYRFNKRRSQK